MHHAPTHARPNLPLNQNPILTPAEEYALALHDTANEYLKLLFQDCNKGLWFYHQG